jgi:hypothetical protein
MEPPRNQLEYETKSPRDESIPWTDLVRIGLKLAVAWLVGAGVIAMVAGLCFWYSRR